MAADLDDVLNAKFSAHDLFRKQIPKGFNLDRTFHFAFDPSTKFGVPLQVSAARMFSGIVARANAYASTGRLCKLSIDSLPTAPFS